MEPNTLKIAASKCFDAINKCIQLRNKEAVICKHLVVITKEDLNLERVTVKTMDKVTGVMRSYGVKNARYQKGASRFYGVVCLDTAVLVPGMIPLTDIDEPVTYIDELMNKP